MVDCLAGSAAAQKKKPFGLVSFRLVTLMSKRLMIFLERSVIGTLYSDLTHRIHGAAIYGNMDPINIPQSC